MLRATLPWLVAAGIFALLLRRIPLAALGAALATGPWPLLVAYVAIEVALVLLADAWATSVALRWSDGALPYWRLVGLRGASYLFQVLHPLAGQGSFGWFLARAGRGGWAAGGTVLLLLATQLLTLAVVGAFGLLGAPTWLRGSALPLAALVIAGIALYLGLVRLRPGWLERLILARPLLSAGVSGHLVAMVSRLPHVLLIVVLHWGAFRLWGIPIPFLAGAAYIPPILLVAALPITPAGLGTVQAMQLALFSRWAPGATAGEREAAIVALSLAHVALVLLGQALIGFFCLRRVRGPAQGGAAPNTTRRPSTRHGSTSSRRSASG